jgi:hypothetical protein
MENLEQEKISKVKSKFEKEHTKISVFLSPIVQICLWW